VIELRSTLCSRVLRQGCAGTSCAPHDCRQVGVYLSSVEDRVGYQDGKGWRLNYCFEVVESAGERDYGESKRIVRYSGGNQRKSAEDMGRSRRCFALVSRVAK